MPKIITDDRKRTVDAWQALLNYWWGEYQEKTKLEWKISIIIWAVLASAIGGILADKISHEMKQLIGNHPILLRNTMVGFLIGLSAIHEIFIWWIQRRLKEIRTTISEIRKGIHELLGIKENSKPYNILRHSTPFLQSIVTLSACFFLVVYIFIFKQ
jgi:hypothetical protein